MLCRSLHSRPPLPPPLLPLQAAGVVAPRAAAVCLSQRDKSVEAVGVLRREWPAMPIYASALDFK